MSRLAGGVDYQAGNGSIDAVFVTPGQNPTERNLLLRLPRFRGGGNIDLMQLDFGRGERGAASSKKRGKGPMPPVYIGGIFLHVKHRFYNVKERGRPMLSPHPTTGARHAVVSKSHSWRTT
jgi:hypothetical protein